MTRGTRNEFDRRELTGPFDIIGDVHGCLGELRALLDKLGYRVHEDRRGIEVEPPAGRRALFVGDLVDRGPDSPGVLRLAMAMVSSGSAHAVPGNHDAKFVRWLAGRNVTMSHGLAETVRQFEGQSDAFKLEVSRFFGGLPTYLWLDGGELVVAHAGIREDMIGRDGERVRSFCLYGDTDGHVDAKGLALRYHWAAQYAGSAAIVYGHTPIERVEWINNTLCIDTGCCFGGALTALRWPERELVAVPAMAVHAPRLRPFGHPPERPA